MTELPSVGADEKRPLKKVGITGRLRWKRRPRTPMSRPARVLWGSFAGLLFAVGLLGVGIAIGWHLMGNKDLPTAEASVIEVPIPEYGADSQSSMPDVRGLDEDAARSALADAGIPVSVLAIRNRGAAGQPGLVIEQQPAFGTKNPAKVELVVSKRAVVPNVVGMDDSDAYSSLRALGARVESIPKYVPGTDPGIAVKVSPKPGSDLGDSVKVYVSEAAASTYLASVPTVEGACRTGAAQLNGQTYQDSVLCSVAAGPASVVWVVGRKADRLTAMLGVPDDGPDGVKVTATVYADGRPVAKALASYGKPTELKADLAGALRIEVRLSISDSVGGESGSITTVLGDARLFGSTAAIGELTHED